MKVLLVGDDNFTFAQCMIDNLAQWRSKLNCGPDEHFSLEVTSCLSEAKIPFEFKNNHDKVKARTIPIHYSANPALLRQYFPSVKPGNITGPPYDVIVHLLPGLQYEGAPRFIDRTSPLFQLRIHLYWFAIAKSSTVICQDKGMILYIWIDQEQLRPEDAAASQLPFPLVDVEKLGPFCKIQRCKEEDFPLNLTWGSYKTAWKPLIHNAELWHFPAYLEKMKVYVFRNESVVPNANINPDEYNLLKIPQSICQWNRQVLSHVNELFHFNMRTSTPGEMLQISKLSVKYDPRINGWRNMGTPAAVPKKQAAPQCESWSTLLNKSQQQFSTAPPPVIEDRPWYATDQAGSNKDTHPRGPGGPPPSTMTSAGTGPTAAPSGASPNPLDSWADYIPQKGAPTTATAPTDIYSSWDSPALQTPAAAAPSGNPADIYSSWETATAHAPAAVPARSYDVYGSSRNAEPSDSWKQTGDNWKQPGGGGDSWKQSGGSDNWKQPGDGDSWKQSGGGGDSWKQSGGSDNWKQPGGGDSWKQSGAGDSWKQSGAGDNWKQPGAGDNWKQPGAGDNWKQPGGDNWKQSGGGDNWKQPGGGDNWKQPGGGDSWKQPGGGDNWKQTGGGDNWKQPGGGDNWKQAGGGDNWKQSGAGDNWKPARSPGYDASPAGAPPRSYDPTSARNYDAPPVRTYEGAPPRNYEGAAPRAREETRRTTPATKKNSCKPPESDPEHPAGVPLKARWRAHDDVCVV
ncbi:hypothetical protein GNI_024620 [Gregarina niphandrodes]|uniref:Uncharacterized protein n=1 Tax=Gregarina niphandrodes TaxID=110365 RepID=A0A023BBN0_GRENI|nr:hypothetical protein GNI_024620 [Gregarina niphandrodes]EZG79711.1 hypothetical protein GNI_024620 [Gregarina niphandrodes]|eukprot:XP_011134393.1 hypothetical protein GNI_024620 [Gregarina niphandrodes]